MKQILCLTLVCALLVLAAGCSTVGSLPEGSVTLTFRYGETNITLELPREEAARVREILERREAEPFSGIPSCGFTPDISLTVGGSVFCLACDTCNILREGIAGAFCTISQEDMEYLHTLFGQYGGYFPCI